MGDHNIGSTLLTGVQDGGLASLEAALASCQDVAEAAAAVVDHLSGYDSFLPSLYIERGGRLRCQAMRGYPQVIDGIPPEAGVMGEVFRSDEAVVLHDAHASPKFISAVSGVSEECSVPIRVGDQVVGVLNVEAKVELPDDVLGLVTRCAELFARRLEEIGGPPPESTSQRLARHIIHMASLQKASEIQRATAAAACDLTGMSSALVALVDPPPSAKVAVGPLSDALRRLRGPEIDAIASHVRWGSSCWSTADDEGLVRYDLFRAAGAGAVIVLPLMARGTILGMLVVADRLPSSLHTEDVERLELLAAQAASCLQTAQAMSELREQARQDPLTGLGHQAAFQVAFRSARAELPADSRVAVIVIDVDNFKSVNDGYGHVEGDRVLVNIAATLASALRGNDRLFRIGGDEFASVVVVHGEEEATAIARRLHQAVEATGIGTVSLGVAVAGEGESDVEAQTRADAALYRVKAAGRNGVALAQPPDPAD